jgi:two-component system, cell cycle response regulator DivK
MQREKKSSAVQGIPQFNGKKILIVEDDVFSMEMMVYQLEKTNCTLFTANDGSEAIRIFENKYVDLVLLDIGLPGMDGYEVLRELLSRNPDMPIIAQTAYAMLDDVKKIKEAGFTDYILKPAGQTELYKLLKKYLSSPHTG